MTTRALNTIPQPERGEIEAEVIRLQATDTASMVGAKFGLSKTAVQRIWAKAYKAGLITHVNGASKANSSQRQPHPRLAPEIYPAVIAAYGKTSRKALARLHGISPSTVNDIWKKARAAGQIAGPVLRAEAERAGAHSAATKAGMQRAAEQKRLASTDIVPINDGDGISLFDADRLQCRYPVAGEGAALRVCGHTVSAHLIGYKRDKFAPYCDTHCARAFMEWPPKPRVLSKPRPPARFMATA